MRPFQSVVEALKGLQSPEGMPIARPPSPRLMQTMDSKVTHFRMSPILPIIPQPGGLLRLPDHILLVILHNIVKVVDLYLLALASRRLNRLAMPLFLSRYGISDARTSAQITLQDRRNKLVTVDALSGLRVALAVTSIDRLNCTFDFSEQPLSSFFAEFRRLQSLLSRLAWVGQIIIDLRGGLHALELSKDPVVSEEWTGAFNLLCETITRRPENGVVIITSKLATRIYTSARTETGTMRRQNSRLEVPMRRRLLGGDKGPFDPRAAALTRPRSFSQPFAPRVTLASITINSPSLLSHYLGWTLSILRSAPVNSLILPDLQLPGLMWSSALPQIAASVPFLSKLVISDPNIFRKDLLSFVSKLPLLESLQIDRSLRLFSQSALAHPKLPHLAMLSAPPEYVSILLAAKGGLPNLQSLEVVLQNVTHVAAPHTTETFSNILHRLREANSHVTPTLNIYVGSNSLQSMLSKSIDASLSMGHEWQKCIRVVTDVVLDGLPLAEALKDTCLWAYFPRFLGIFPNVERLTIRGPGDSRSKPIPFIITSISHRCAKLQMVTVNEVIYNVSALNSASSPIRADNKRLTVTDLPEDVLNHIFNHLSTDLYPLALVSRHFNMIAIPRFLSLHGITQPAVTSYIMPREYTPTPDALSGLQASLFIPSIDHLWCRFSRCSSIHATFDQMYRFRHLVSRLTLVSKVTIDFGTGEHLKTANDMLLSKWVSLLGGLLNVILEKSCHTLAVIGGSHFLQTYQLRRRREPFLLKETPGPMRGNTWMFSRPPDQGAEAFTARLSPKAQSTSKLRSFTIESEILLRPPFLTWTIAAIKASPLVHLNASEVPSDLSHIALPLLADAAPKLPELALSGDLNPDEVFHFVDKFSQLRWLSLGRRLILDPEDTDSLSRPKLKKLTHLSAPIEFISYLTEKPLPSLKAVTIALKNPSLTNPNHITLAHTLVAISRRLQSFSIAPTFGMDIAVAVSAAWMARDASVISANEPRWENAMKVITTVTLKDYDTLHCAIEDPSLPITRVLPKWVSLFPGLQNVVLEERQQSPLASFINLGWAIMRACPDLTSVMVNGQYLQGQRW